MRKLNFVKYVAFAFAMSVCGTACSDDDPTPNPDLTPDPKDVSFIVTSGDPENDLKGGVGLKIFSDLTTPKNNLEVYGDNSGNTLKVPDTFTQVTYNRKTGTFTGYIYARGASEEGIGSMKAGLRSYKIADGKLAEIGQPVIVANFGNTGTFGTYSYAAQISNPYAMVVSRNGDNITGDEKTIELPGLAIDGVVPTVSNFVDMGDNKLVIVLNYSNRDSAAVAFADYNLSISSVKYDGRIGVSVGAMRSVRYAQSGADDEGNVYIFSGSGVNSNRVGALRIKKGASDFDPDYHFNIFAKSDGYRFRKAFHISDDYFLLEFYNSKDEYANMSPSGKMAVVKMSDQSLKWVTGLPDPTTVSIGWADGYKGVMYLPMAAPTEMSGTEDGSGNVIPTIYAINAATGVAASFATFKTTELLKAVTIIK